MFGKGGTVSEELSRARQQLSMVRTYLKQDKVMTAAQAMQSAVLAMIKTQLIQAERRELEKIVADALHYLGNSETVRTAYPMPLTYTPGSERALYDTLTNVLTALTRTVAEDAQAQMEATERKKREWLERGIAEMALYKEKGQETLAALVRTYPTDPQLKGSVGEALLHAGLYERAVSYLTEALDMKPDMLPYYNVIGIALRKLARFDVAESYYLRASQYLRSDPNLYFNIGRLYIDWQKWAKAVQAAEVALKLNPDFIEAAKLRDYAKQRVPLEG